jgi:hypothetical protein
MYLQEFERDNKGFYSYLLIFCTFAGLEKFLVVGSVGYHSQLQCAVFYGAMPAFSMPCQRQLADANNSGG